ncbi:DUF983 domain-containing protein [Parvibaculum sp.]|jgi:uncharacterized protein (DUF983 family)|uniref:DUF983 domain-containing protein n=1 Tax=Parvibaculum sp. TaxID=2024848 RepID=UPI000C367831|nr:DUF983 domain-containing protein [Parvibaculum sp.]HAC57365.1 hypothetical protein [Rhodobiaceae bacterium]MAU62039.1 hypothetical protein [Parvibaculum sp.]MBO6666931.1 DUF983 domain-containing protein [Parvibaculum sp.]MBO6690375.1 DUF983 domain-containing protein [Parvibaculum sp.]MBO6713552.1 DUF983 domain-containing protein [Parvibaculum sp.]|tara:strand:- start:4360 stop:4734 length:375 start_codon:yes stop_codon:yes gene_type:complete
MSEAGEGAPSSIEVGLRGCCPRCGKGKLYKGFLDLAPRCEVCGLDYSFADSGDGPAVFIMMIAGFVIVGLVLWVEFTWSPPYWVHAVLWIPLTLALTIGLIRPLKGWLVAQQFRHKAEEGRLEK